MLTQVYAVHYGLNAWFNFLLLADHDRVPFAPGLEQHQHFQQVGVLIHTQDVLLLCEQVLHGQALLLAPQVL